MGEREVLATASVARQDLDIDEFQAENPRTYVLTAAATDPDAPRTR